LKELNLPNPYSVGVTLLGGVARTVDAYTAMHTARTNEDRTSLDLISPPFPKRLPRCAFGLYAAFR
jgi:hypothetical protein